MAKAKKKTKKVVKAKAKSKSKPAKKKPIRKAPVRKPPKKTVKAKAKAKAKKPVPKAKPKAKAKAKKPAPKAKPKAVAKPAPKAAPAKPVAKVRKPVVYVSPATIPPAKIHRRDGAGHLDPDYAERLLELSGSAAEREEDESHAFVSDHEAVSREPLSRELGREVIEQATTGEYVAEDNLNAEVEEEEGGPFVPSTDAEEVAHGTDESNPKGAKREPFPKTSGSGASGDDDDE